MENFKRFELQIGNEAMKKLNASHVAIFGIGGVGGAVVEALARSGIGKLTLVDGDTIEVTNINRQIVALESTIEKLKTEVMKQRILDINKNAKVFCVSKMFSKNTTEIDFSKFDFVVDAVDDVEAKIEIIKQAKLCGKNVISAMGAGNKFDPLKLKVDDISKTTVCPLAKIVREKLKKMQINGVKCAFSTEKPIKTFKTISSNAFVPCVMGTLIAKEVVFDLIKKSC